MAPRNRTRRKQPADASAAAVALSGFPALAWTTPQLDAALARVGDGDPSALDALIDQLDRDRIEIALGVEEPPDEPRAKRNGGKGRDESSDPLALLYREAERRPRPTRDEERRIFRRLVFARRRLERTLRDRKYSADAVSEFLRRTPCVAFRGAENGPNATGACADDAAPCIRFASHPGVDDVRRHCCTYHETRNAFVVRFLYLVLGMVRRFRDRGIDTADLVQEGSAALLRAVEDFEPERGFRFSTYARWWVNQAFLRTLYNNLRTVRMPVYLQKAAAKVMRHAGDRDFREVDLATLSTLSGVPESTIRILVEFSRSTVSIDAKAGDGDRARTLADPKARFRPESLDRRDVKSEVGRVLDVLDPRERVILRLRFGLDASLPRTLEEVGTQLKLSRERVRQIQEEALAKLRSPLHLERLRDLLDV